MGYDPMLGVITTFSTQLSVPCIVGGVGGCWHKGSANRCPVGLGSWGLVGCRGRQLRARQQEQQQATRYDSTVCITFRIFCWDLLSMFSFCG